MSLPFPSAALAALLPLLGATGPGIPPARGLLRVCADPNNLPFSNRREQGYENRIADLLAARMHLEVRYTWWAQRRGFIRHTLNAHRCDVVMGLPAGDPMVLTTAPYYRSSYVFLYRRDRGLRLASWDDPALRHLRIGIHVAGGDQNPPPMQALSRRGIVRNVVGYSLYGNYARPNPPARLVDAVARGEVDVAIIWGPFAGYFAPREPAPLAIRPVVPLQDGPGPGVPFAFDIAVGVRLTDSTLRARLDSALADQRPRIRAVLARYGVPLLSSDHLTPGLSTAGARTTCDTAGKAALCE
jgi:mxaJ protein